MSVPDPLPLSLTLPGAVGLDASAADAAIERTVLELFDEYRRPVTRYVLSFGLPASDAEDVVQEVFLALFSHLQRRRPDTNLAGWLFQVARNLALRHRRRGRRWWRWLQPAAPDVDARIDPAASPEALLTDAEQQQQWQRILQALPDRDRQCLVLRAEGLTYREIAAALGVSLGAVAKSMARALARFERVEER